MIFTPWLFSAQLSCIYPSDCPDVPLISRPAAEDVDIKLVLSFVTAWPAIFADVTLESAIFAVVIFWSSITLVITEFAAKLAAVIVWFAILAPVTAALSIVNDSLTVPTFATVISPLSPLVRLAPPPPPSSAIIKLPLEAWYLRILPSATPVVFTLERSPICFVEVTSALAAIPESFVFSASVKALVSLLFS